MPMRWYIMHCGSGRELSVADRIHTVAAEHGLMHLLDNVVVLTGEGQRSYPGYVLIRCELTDEFARRLRAIPDVTGFLGRDGPMPIPDTQIDGICGRPWRDWAANLRTVRVPPAQSVALAARPAADKKPWYGSLLARLRGRRAAEKRWYVVLIRGFAEGQVLQSIPANAQRNGLADLVDQVVSLDPDGPARRDRGVSAPSCYPGHVLVRCALTDAVRDLIASTPNVSAFLGGETPIAISDEDARIYIREVHGHGPDGPRGSTVQGNVAK